MKAIVLLSFVLLCIGNTSFTQTLEEYFQIAAENNPELKAKYKRAEAAMEKIPQVSTLQDPSFSFGFFISPVETRVGSQHAKFSLTQMFPWFGTLKAQGNVAALNAEAQFQVFNDAKNKLYYKVAQAYYPLFELYQIEAIEKENKEILETLKTIANSKYENGKGSMVDLLRVDMMIDDVKTNLSILESQKKPLKTRFNKLLNRDQNDSITIPTEVPSIQVQSFEERDSLFAEHPLMEQLNLQIKASEAKVLAVKKQGLPKIGVGLDYVMVGKRTDMDVPDNGKDVLMPMVTMTIPIFRKKYRAAEKEANLMRESYQFQKEALDNQLTVQYENTLFKLQQQDELIELYEQQTQRTEQSMRLILKSYQNTGKDFEEVLRMQQQLLKYQKLNIKALVEYHIAVEEIYYITSKNKL
ncbi:MAG: transporter [Fluviicola sp.]|nr:MAG: transporter [Fluviicola sp.]